MTTSDNDSESPAVDSAMEIMLDFASITGLDPPSHNPKRYLWTDAFAVCNYLELYRQTNDENFLKLALKLINQVHHTLGRYREDDPREGWISGLNDEYGEIHPTKGGLRIGKELNERLPTEPFDERLEWDRDGQYYHYLTKWMHALSRASGVTGDPVYSRWAVELARAAHVGFTYSTPGGKRMYWKMSIDLQHPQVPSMGQHDPLDGYITYNELQISSQDFEQDLPDLTPEIEDMAKICKSMSLVTDDPLGIGGLLSDALRVGQLMVKSNDSFDLEILLQDLLTSALLGLKSYAQNNPQDFPAVYRLAFREMGVSIGIKGMEYLKSLIESNEDSFKEHDFLYQPVEALKEYMPLADSLEKFWLKDENRKSNTWLEHREINMVMVATSLTPCGFLRI